MQHPKTPFLLAFGFGLLFSASASAQTVTGTVESTITLTRACQINGATDTTNVAFGVLDFGAHTTLFTDASAQVQGNGGAITIQCSPGASATLTFAAGLHDAAVAGSGRAMGNGSLMVPYDLYSDAALSTVIPVGGTQEITADGTVQTVNVYGRALGAPGLTAATYTDTIAVTLAF